MKPSEWARVYEIVDKVAIRYAMADEVINTGWQNDAMRWRNGEYNLTGEDKHGETIEGIQAADTTRH